MNQKEIKQKLDRIGIPYKEFRFWGHSLGWDKGFPREKDQYRVMHDIWLDHFYTGEEEVVENGARWIRVAKIFRKGDGGSASIFWALYVRAQDVKKIKDII